MKVSASIPNLTQPVAKPDVLRSGFPSVNRYEANLSVQGFKAAADKAVGVFPVGAAKQAVEVTISPEAKVLFEQFTASRSQNVEQFSKGKTNE